MHPCAHERSIRGLAARRPLKKHCRHHEKWHCGPATIYFTGRDPNPRFDRRMEIYVNQPPGLVDVSKVSRLLRLLDRLGRKSPSYQRGWPFLRGRWKR